MFRFSNKLCLTTGVMCIGLLNCSTTSPMNHYETTARRVHSVRQRQTDGTNHSNPDATSNMVAQQPSTAPKGKKLQLSYIGLVHNIGYWILSGKFKRAILEKFHRSAMYAKIENVLKNNLRGMTAVESAIRGGRPMQRLLQVALRKGVNDNRAAMMTEGNHTAVVPNARFIRSGYDVLHDSGEPVLSAILLTVAYLGHQFLGGWYFVVLFSVLVHLLPLLGFPPMIGGRFTDMLPASENKYFLPPSLAQTFNVVRNTVAEETKEIKVEDARTLLGKEDADPQKDMFDRTGFTEVTVGESIRKLDWKLLEQSVSGDYFDKDSRDMLAVYEKEMIRHVEKLHGRMQVPVESVFSEESNTSFSKDSTDNGKRSDKGFATKHTDEGVTNKKLVHIDFDNFAFRGTDGGGAPIGGFHLDFAQNWQREQLRDSEKRDSEGFSMHRFPPRSLSDDNFTDVLRKSFSDECSLDDKLDSIKWMCEKVGNEQNLTIQAVFGGMNRYPHSNLLENTHVDNFSKVLWLMGFAQFPALKRVARLMKDYKEYVRATMEQTYVNKPQEVIEESSEKYQDNCKIFNSGITAMLARIREIFDEELRRFMATEEVVLGLWKPLNTVKDSPLAVMDASTFDSADEVPLRNYARTSEHVRLYLEDTPWHKYFWNGGDKYGGVKFVDNVPVHVTSRVKLNEKQKFYYFPDMDDSKLLIFTHFTKHKDWCNVHGAIKIPTAADTPKRQSLEVRAKLYYIDESAWEEFEAARKEYIVTLNERRK